MIFHKTESPIWDGWSGDGWSGDASYLEGDALFGEGDALFGEGETHCSEKETHRRASLRDDHHPKNEEAIVSIPSQCRTHVNNTTISMETHSMERCHLGDVLYGEGDASPWRCTGRRKRRMG